MCGERKERLLERLKRGAGDAACGGYLASLDGLQRTEVYTSLLFDRLGRKMRTVEALHREALENWNQTFYLLYFRTLGDATNREAFLELARRVPYRIVLRERLVPHGVEAMLLGASGLLQRYCHDAYTLDLGRSFEYLAAKYGIEPMEDSAWHLASIRPANHPVLRIAQAAEFFTQDELIMDRTMSCRSEEDIRRLFCAETADYWRTHYLPAARSDARPKRIGVFKANIIAINLVAVLQFAYGSYTGREALRDNALALLERLPPEENGYMRRWSDRGIAPRSAFESQALLQLATEYCARQRCEECFVGRRLLARLAEE